ncbi:MAG: hypothetical protein ABIQ32_03255 [Sphingomicrobium sp.]
MSYREDSYEPFGGVTEDDEQDQGNYFARHWRGNLSLPRSYWVNGFLTNLTIGGLGLAFVTLSHTGRSLRVISACFLFYVVAFLVARTWTLIGVWRSAGRHAARGGAPRWGVVARGLVVLGVLATAIQMPALAVKAKEYGQIAIGRDPLGGGATLRVNAGGKTLEMKGMLTAGVADRLEHILRSNPNVGLLQLDSGGGRIFEALRIADVIRSRHLNTRVEERCESACTLILMAGKERSADGFAQIGFHQPDFPGLNDRERLDIIADNRRDYIAAGIEPSFLEKALSTPPNDMWYPTHVEMVEADVLSFDEMAVRPPQVQLGHLHKLLSRMEAEINASRGTMIDDITRLDGARLNGSELRTEYGLTRAFNAEESINLKSNLASALSDDLCAGAKRALIEHGARFGFDYSNPDGRKVASVTIDRCPSA